MIQDLSSDYLPIFPLFYPNVQPPSFNFQKARWDDFAFYFNFHCSSAVEYFSLSFPLRPATARATALALNAAKFSIPSGRVKRQFQGWLSREVEEAVSEKRKAFAAAHGSDKDRQAYNTASLDVLSVVAKDKAEAWQATCSSFFPKSNSKSVHALLRFVAEYSSLSSSSLISSSVFLPGRRKIPLSCFPAKYLA